MPYLYFGPKLTQNAIKDVNTFAVNWEISIDTARILYLKKIVELLSDNGDKSSYWDGLFGRFSKRNVKAPKLIVQEAIEPGGYRLPVINLDHAYMIEATTNMMIPIDDQVLEKLGEEIEREFGVEYLEFSRKKLVKSRTATIF